MTLIITCATPRFVIQVADTKLTLPDGTLYDDELVKTTIVHCRDAKVATSYTGLALIDRIRTDKWLATELYRGRAWEKSFPAVVELVRQRLNDALKANRALEQIGLTVVVGGLGSRQLALATITNCERVGDATRSGSFQSVSPQGRYFEKLFYNPNRFDRLKLISFAGAVPDGHLELSGLRRKVFRTLHTVSSDHDRAELTRSLVAMLRLQARDSRLGHLIGKDCTAVRIDSDLKSTSLFFSESGKVDRFPNIVGPDFMLQDLAAAVWRRTTAIPLTSGGR